MIIVFQVGLALLRYCEDDLVCLLTLILIDYGLEVSLYYGKENNTFTLMNSFWYFNLGSYLRLNS